MKELSEILNDCPVLPILAFRNTEEAVTVCRGIYEAGIKVIEIAMTHKSSLDAIIAVKADLPADASIGAGNIISLEMAETAIAVGSTFGSSPGFTSQLGRAIKSLRWPFLPAASTISEAMHANELGYKILKYISTSGLVNVDCLHSISYILPQLSICPVNGVDKENFPQVLALPNVSTVSGSWLVRRQEDGSFDLDKIKTNIQELRSQLPTPEPQYA